jgi:hypothetical protein
MRLPTISLDFWHLVSGEERHQAAPSTFEIPSLAERSSLTPGQGAKLIFEIEAEEEDGTVSTSTERMWVIVSRRADDYYIGVLDSEPVTVPNDGEFYLCRGAKIPFQPVHVIAVSNPPEEYAEKVLSSPPVKRWAPRGA